MGNLAKAGHGKKFLVGFLAGGFLAAIVALALAVAALAADGAIKGVVLNTTCPGPCRINQDPQPYTGDAVVVVKHLRSGDVVSTLNPQQGQFRASLRRGRYRVSVTVGDPNTKPSCWQGESKTVSVGPKVTTELMLHVNNGCVQ